MTASIHPATRRSQLTTSFAYRTDSALGSDGLRALAQHGKIAAAAGLDDLAQLLQAPWNVERAWTFAASGRETTYLPRALRGLAAAKLPTYLRLFVRVRAT